MSLLSDKRRGHSLAAFNPAHSYTWGIIYLIHRTNSPVPNGASHACGDLGRDRLISGAVSYNGGGVPDYRDRIIEALRLFGGLATPQIEEDADEFLITPIPPSEPRPVPGLSRFAAIALVLLGVTGVLLAGWSAFKPLAYADNFATVAPQLITNLAVIAILMERALAAVNTIWFGAETEFRRSRLTAARALISSSQNSAGVVEEFAASSSAMAETEAKRARVRVVLGFLSGLAISGAGIRTLAILTKPTECEAIASATKRLCTVQDTLFHTVDIILTAGLLAGGSAGMAKLAELIRAAIEGTKERLLSNR